MTEVQVVKPMWHEGRSVEPGAVIALAEQDAAYLASIGRVARIVSPAMDEQPAKPAARRKAKGAAE